MTLNLRKFYFGAKVLIKYVVLLYNIKFENAIIGSVVQLDANIIYIYSSIFYSWYLIEKKNFNISHKL